ncbi:hypothetical protein [Flavobacterium piscis]|uniref:Uncharacterized protein n=1 Tax=Flavobacterium piscis TaxID=1114874 RepID=A0ABU1Y7C2_9FLAO|nr:hypothetical protein [Flavobacterium piscis]MDR7210140.1 hypothetical protein [Flavobacterium piscis]
MNIFNRKPKKAQFIIEHENRLANYAKSVNGIQESIYKDGLISAGNLYTLIAYHYWFAFSSFYTNLRVTNSLEMISFEDAVKKYSDIHTDRINKTYKYFMEEYEDKPVSAQANGYLKILLQELTEQSTASLNDDLYGSVDILSLMK